MLLPAPRYAAVKRTRIAGMKHLRALAGSAAIRNIVGNGINGRGVAFVQQIHGLKENRNPFAQLHSDFESEQGIGWRIKGVGVVNGIWRYDPIHVWSRVETAGGFIHQLRLIDIDRHAGDAVVAKDGIVVEMKIAQGVVLAQGEAVAEMGLVLLHKNRVQQPDFQASLNALIIRLGNVYATDFLIGQWV